MRIRTALGRIGCWLGCLAAPLTAMGNDRVDVGFFEQKIRPVLVQQCYACHSSQAKNVKGGLRLDTRSGLLEGGDSGPALVPGAPDESLILEALRYDFLEMPPEGKLPDPVVADFERWIAGGAPDPREGPSRPTVAGIDLDAGRQFWAYQPPERHEPPATADEAWPRTDIDRFILDRLEADQLHPVGDADPTVLVRRLYFDLVGLPPTPEEIDAFVADASPSAYAALVDRLLASPQFGERWGRHWLDLARFAESVTLRGLVLKPAWRYRDYVIEAFNADMPFDQFLREQVAGDLLPADDLDDRRRQLVATAFLNLGNTNLEEQDKNQLRMDVVDEQIDTISKAVLAQTIACARCHDHKFDPIPTRDYYAIAGILRNAKAMEHSNVSAWVERPLPIPPEQEALLAAHDKAVADVEAKLKSAKAKALKASKTSKVAGVLAVGDLPGIVVDDSQARRVGTWQESQFSGSYIGQGYLHDQDAGKGEKSLTFQPKLPAAGSYDVWLAYSTGGSRSVDTPVTILSADGETTVKVDMRAEPPIDGRFVALGRFRFEANDQGFVLISNVGTSGHVTADAVIFLPEKGADRIALSGKPTAPDPEAEQAAAELRNLEDELKRLKAEGPVREMTVSVLEEETIEDARVHLRGSVQTLGDEVPRGFLQVATLGETAPLPSSESGRRELADWLAGTRNTLTARVIVNRSWHWLFGAGLVRTTDNFGTTGEIPSHPELLDDLAVRFVEDDAWSIKALVRRIVLSRTYQLATAEDRQARSIDPENRLLWTQNRRRLDAECIRDTMLAVSGDLDLSMGGSGFNANLPADYGFEHTSKRRSVYEPVFRNALPELFEVFDFADPSLVIGVRNVSTVAPQALFLMNHPFALEQARHAADLLLAGPTTNTNTRIDRAYRLTLGRLPSGPERRLARACVEGSTDPLDAWSTLFQALFASLDFRYLD